MNFQCVGVAKEGKIKRAPGLICVLIDVQPSDVGDVGLVMLVKNFMDIIIGNLPISYWLYR